MQEVFDFAEEKMMKRIDLLRSEYVTIRAGKVTASLLDRLRVDYYGVPTPIRQVAAVSVSEGRNLLIQPWDIGLINKIERAVQASDLGVNPMNDGRVVRLSFPALTGEKRRQLVKDVGKIAEEARISVRNIRREAIDRLKKMEKDKQLGEDERHDGEDRVQKLTDKYINEIDELTKKKEADIMEL